MKDYLAFDNITAYGNVKAYEQTTLSTGEKAVKISTKDGAWIEFTGENGRLGGVDFTSDKILVVPVYFLESHSVYFKLEFYEDEASPDHADMAMGVLPGFTVNIELALSSLDLNALFLRRTPGRLKNTSTGTPVKAENLRKFIFRIPASNDVHTICIGQPYVTDTSPEHNIPSVPYIDSLGQWKMKDWKFKTKDFAELKENYAKWVSEDLRPMFVTENRSAYGGDASENFGASGYFRTHNHNGVWYLIDPEGFRFYSIGVDCVGTHMAGPTDGIEGLFEELPSKDGEYQDAWYSGQFCFNAKNLIFLYGGDWQKVWEKLTAKRLKYWGFNTVANWSAKGFGQRNGIPYVIETPFPRTEKNIFRDFPDVFSPEYEEKADECAKFLNAYKDDSYLIGYFLRNEPNWAFGDYNIAHMMLSSSEETFSRREFVRFITEKYNGDVGEFNSAWNVNFTGFDELLHQPFAAQLTGQAIKDTREFTRKLIHKYIEVPSLACKKVDGNHMNLGMRWAWIASEDFYEGAEYMDVFSINCYQKAPDPKEIAHISKMSGKPVMIGEFHAGALDAGLPANALQGVASQSERGYFYSYYMENGAVIPELIGCHYFQYNDQAATGRFDGENLNIGLVDVCGKPYDDMIEKIMETNKAIYDIRGGKRPPTSRKAVEAIREGF